MARTSDKPKRRPGRPSKAEELRRALAELGCDPSAIDPLRILAGIAADEAVSPAVRVAACKALLERDSEPPAMSPLGKKEQAQITAEQAHKGSTWSSLVQ
jgi:hypothetical protein